LRWVLICTALFLAACRREPQAHQSRAEGPLLLHAVYRDTTGTMVLVIPENGHAEAPRGDCTAPLLINSLSGQARVLTPGEVQARLRTMQLTGASRSGCPRN